MKKYLIVAALEEESQGLFEKLPNCNVIYTGVGKLNAALELTFCISSPRAVINLGTTGGNLLDVGHVFQIHRFIQNDIDNRFTNKEDLEINLKKFTNKFITKQCFSADKFYEKDTYGIPSLFDMEGYALARVCSIFDIPFISLKYVSDTGSIEEWKKSLPIAAEALYKAALALIEELDKKPLNNY